MNHTHRSLAVATVVVMLGACTSDEATATLDGETISTTILEAESGTDPDQTATTVDEPTATPSPTTKATTTTTTTSTPTTTVPEATVADTTVPTATDAKADLLAEIEEDLNENEQAFLAAGSDPGGAKAAAALEAHFTGAARENFQSFFAQLAETGRRVRANPDEPSFVRVLEVLEASDRSASLRICRIDAAVIFIPPNEDFPDGAIFNDEVLRYVNRITVDFDGTRWRSAGGESIDSATIERSEEAACDGF